MSRARVEYTAAEMLTLREPPYCMSNKEIAEQLGISYNTVLNYIGTQRQPKQDALIKLKPRAVIDTPPDAFDNAQSLTRLTNAHRSYLVDIYSQRVELDRPLVYMEANDLRNIINELVWIDTLLQKAREEGHAKCK